MIVHMCHFISQITGEMMEYPACDGYSDWSDAYERPHYGPCGDDRLPVGIVNGRKAFAVHTTTSEVDLLDLPF